MMALYKGSRFSYSQLKTAYQNSFDDPVLNVNKIVYLLTNYISLKIGKTNEEYNKTIKEVYKEYTDKYIEEMEPKVAKAEADFQLRKNKGIPSSSST